MKPVPKDYLGDGVYAECKGHLIILTTEDGIRVTNEIILDQYTLKALLRFIERCKEAE